MKPEVRITQQQTESEPKPVNISKEEEEYLIWKYYGQYTNDDKYKPKGESPKTINGEHYSDVNYSKIETPIGDIEIKVSINSTMPIPKK